MVIILFDNSSRDSLYPFTQTRAIADLRFGILTAKERWEMISGLPVNIKTADYLAGLYDNLVTDAVAENDFLYIDASLKDEDALRSQLLSLQTGEAIYDHLGLVAGRTSAQMSDFKEPDVSFDKHVVFTNYQRLTYPWQLVEWNDEQLRKDFLLLFSRSTTKALSESNKIIQPENIIIEDGAIIEHCFINAATGPVYIAKNAVVMEGAMLRGPVAIGEGAVVKMGAKIYGAATISPYCNVGGEIKNSVLQSFSNKAHDGYLGDAAIGAWCNIGAGTSNSNVKNSADNVFVYHKSSNSKLNAGKKCGVIMGDYTRTSINTSINTGSVFGVCCNIFGSGLSPHTMNNFSWGMHDASIYNFDKAVQHINNWEAFKGRQLSTAEISVLKYIFDRTHWYERIVK